MLAEMPAKRQLLVQSVMLSEMLSLMQTGMQTLMQSAMQSAREAARESVSEAEIERDVKRDRERDIEAEIESVVEREMRLRMPSGITRVTAPGLPYRLLTLPLTEQPSRRESCFLGRAGAFLPLRWGISAPRSAGKTRQSDS